MISVSLAEHVVLTGTEYGMVLLDERSGRYLQVNETGAEVLRRIRDGDTVDAAVADLCARYPAAADRIPDDVRRLLDALRAAKVIAP